MVPARASVKWISIRKLPCFISWNVPTSDISEIVCGLHCIFYLIHRCAGHSMTDVTRLLENPVEATGIVQKFVFLLVEHVVWKKEKKSKVIAPRCCHIRWSGTVFPTRAEGTFNSLGNLFLALTPLNTGPTRSILWHWTWADDSFPPNVTIRLWKRRLYSQLYGTLYKYGKDVSRRRKYHLHVSTGNRIYFDFYTLDGVFTAGLFKSFDVTHSYGRT
jgi:hypothetical protein